MLISLLSASSAILVMLCDMLCAAICRRCATIWFCDGFPRSARAFWSSDRKRKSDWSPGCCCLPERRDELRHAARDRQQRRIAEPVEEMLVDFAGQARAPQAVRSVRAEHQRHAVGAQHPRPDDEDARSGPDGGPSDIRRSASSLWGSARADRRRNRRLRSSKRAPCPADPN